jgi:CubicO group peptidase (beta-lactamase class C family)
VIAWAGHRGLANVAENIPISPDTRFDFASVSKQFTGLTILRLEEAKKLQLDDSVSEYLDKLPAWADEVTLEQLLHHTSGIPDYTTLLMDAGFEFEDKTTQADALEAIGRTELQSPPGDRFAYSNSNYVLLASIAESVTGEPFGAVAEAEAFGEADLVVEPASTASDVALAYEDGERSVPGWLQVGDGSVVGTPVELAQWADIYRLEATDPAVRAMAEGVDDGMLGTYGAGIIVEPDGALSHSGEWGGFVTLFGVSADRSTAMVVSCNSPDVAISTISSGLLTIWN